MACRRGRVLGLLRNVDSGLYQATGHRRGGPVALVERGSRPPSRRTLTMCGIAGILSHSKPVDSGRLTQMAKAIRHRGPDGAGFHLEADIGMVHTRLAIIDLEGGKQPLHDPRAGVVLTANAEIYNFIELRRLLEARGAEFSTASDCETILHAYHQQGPEFLHSLQGMFAIALYDQQRRVLALARDRLGIKPLFYLLEKDFIAYASEIKALLPLLSGAPLVHPGALAQYLNHQFATGDQTAIRSIHRLPPGCAIEIDADLKISRRRYWDPLRIAPRSLTLAQATDEFDQLIEDVMRQHIRSDVPFGLFLSGGVDSSILLALLQRHGNAPIQTFSVGYIDSGQEDELAAAAAMAAQLESTHTEVRLDRSSIFGRIPLSIWAADELMADLASLPTSLLANEASAGLKVVFTGEGGDESFAGYGRYRPRLRRYLKGLLVPGTQGFRTTPQINRRRLHHLYGEELKNAAALARTPFVAAWRSTPDDWSFIQRAQYCDLTTALPDALLVKVDRMLMACGVEGRVPFLDHRVVEFGLSLPDELKFRGRQRKYLLKEWAERRLHLPREALYRRKRGFHVPLNEWLNGDFLDRLGQKLANNPAIGAWFRPAYIGTLTQRQHRHQDVGQILWSLMQFAIWHRMFIESSDTRRPGNCEDPLDWIT